MKDYSFGEDKNFIKKFKIKGNIIKVYRVGKTEKIPYSKENVDMLLEQMKDQHNFSKDETITKKEYTNNLDKEIIEGIVLLTIAEIIASILPVLGGIYILSKLFAVSFLSLSGICAIVMGGCLGVGFGNLALLKREKKHIGKVKADYDKNAYFLENEEELKNINEKDVKKLKEDGYISTNSISEETKSTPILDINVIRDMSLDDLKNIRTYINQKNAYVELYKYAEQESGFTQVRRNIEND